MLTSQMIKEAALAAGADKCGIGSMDRFEGAPREMDPVSRRRVRKRIALGRDRHHAGGDGPRVGAEHYRYRPRRRPVNERYRFRKNP